MITMNKIRFCILLVPILVGWASSGLWAGTAETTAKTEGKVEIKVVTSEADAFKQAKQLVYRKEWVKAVAAFVEFDRRYGNSDKLPESLYWLAYSLNQMSRESDQIDRQVEIKSKAIAQLNFLLDHFPKSSWGEEGKMLRIEIAADLVELGQTQYKKFISNGAEAESEINIRLMALDALLNMNSRKALPILKKIVEENRDKEVRSRVIFVLSQHDDESIIPLLMEVALKDPDDHVRGQAILWLGQKGGDKALDALADMLKNTPQEFLRKKLVYAVYKAGGERAVEILTQIVKNDESEVVQAEALSCIGEMGRSERLFSLYDGAKAKMKKNIIFGLSEIGGEKAVRFLIDIAHNEKDPEIRKQAVSCLEDSNSDEAIKFLKELIGGA